MTTRNRFVKIVLLAVLVAVAGAPIAAQSASQTPTQFYMAYRTAFDKAKTVADIRPFQSKSVLKQIDATPAAERAQMFEMIKMMGTYTGLKVVKETVTATGATLQVEAIDSDKAKAKGTITLVKEDGAWKIEKENWGS
jgi:hypothetical protein